MCGNLTISLYKFLICLLTSLVGIEDSTQPVEYQKRRRRKRRRRGRGRGRERGRGGKDALIRIELLPCNLKESQNIASEDIIALLKD